MAMTTSMSDHTQRDPKTDASTLEERLRNAGHPQIVTVLKSRKGRRHETYSRALMLQPHGIPLHNPYSNSHCSPGYLQHGISIGDVGYLDVVYGGFVFCFNIYLPQDHPDQFFVPDNFQPYVPAAAESSQTKIIKDYHKPGTIIASPGVKVKMTSSDPLQASFFSLEPEAAVLILPRGASREDLLSSDHLHAYIKRHAEYWYQFENPTNISTPNGKLLLVTGFDKTDRYATATGVREGHTPSMNLRYVQRPDLNEPWEDGGDCYLDWNWDKPTASEYGPNSLCVFLRGIHINLGIKSWASTQPQGDLAHNGYYTIIRHTPRASVYLSKLTSALSIGMSEEVARTREDNKYHSICTPNAFLGQILLSQKPNADLVLVDDHVWSSVIKEGQSCTMSNMKSMVARVLDTYMVRVEEGIVTLTPKVSNGTVLNKSISGGRFGWVRHMRLTEFVSKMEGKSLPI